MHKYKIKIRKVLNKVLTLFKRTPLAKASENTVFCFFI